MSNMDRVLEGRDEENFYPPFSESLAARALAKEATSSHFSEL